MSICDTERVELVDIANKKVDGMTRRRRRKSASTVDDFYKEMMTSRSQQPRNRRRSNSKRSTTPLKGQVVYPDHDDRPLAILQKQPEKSCLKRYPTPKWFLEKRVGFDQLEIRKYPIILGDHPDCVEGPPVSEVNTSLCLVEVMTYTRLDSMLLILPRLLL